MFNTRDGAVDHVRRTAGERLIFTVIDENHWGWYRDTVCVYLLCRRQVVGL